MWSLSVFVPVIAALAYEIHLLRKKEAEIRKNKPRVTDIRIYPIKSCHGISLKTGKITQLGFEHDRAWMVVDASTMRFITQRQQSSMATIVPSFKGDYLCVDAPGMTTLKIPLATTKSANTTVTVWDDTVRAIEEGEESSAWFSKFLNKNVKLVRVDPNVKRVADAKYWTEDIPGPKLVSFADGFPFLMFSKESLKFLNEHIAADKQVEFRRFRPNIVVENVKEPFEEDTWFTFSIREMKFHAIKPCARCKITTINQDTGESTGAEPLNTLQKLRKYEDGAIFGQNVVHETTGYICVGDVIEVEHKKSLTISA